MISNKNFLNQKYLKRKIKKQIEVNSSENCETFISSRNNDTIESNILCVGETSETFCSSEKEENLKSVFSKENDISPPADNSVITQKFAKWTVENKITYTATNSLLELLRNDCNLSFLPKNVRTLLKTPVRTSILKCEVGYYCHRKRFNAFIE